MDATLELCLEDFRSMDAEVRLAALERLLALDDPRVAKSLEALVDDPSVEIARRAREELALRTGEAIGQKWAAPDLGNMEVLDYPSAGFRLLFHHPGPMLGVTMMTYLLAPLVFFLMLAAMAILTVMVALIVKLLLPSGAIDVLVGVMGTLLVVPAGFAFGMILGQVPSIVAGLQAWAVGRVYLDEEVSVSAGWNFARSRMVPLLLTLLHRSLLIAKPLLCGLLVAAAAAGAGLAGCGAICQAVAVLAILVGSLGCLLAMLRYSFADVACTTGGISGKAACLRARRLWDDHSGRIVGFWIVMWVLTLLFQLAAGWVMGESLLFSLVLNLLCTAWFGLSQVVMYYDLTTRQRLTACPPPAEPAR